MPRGHAAKREAKKPKKNAKKQVLSSTVFANENVHVIPKKRKPREEDV